MIKGITKHIRVNDSNFGENWPILSEEPNSTKNEFMGRVNR